MGVRVTKDMIHLTLPLPPRQLHQNARVHWRSRSSATAKYRKLAELAMLKHKARYRQKWPACKVCCVFVFPDKRRRDVSNYLAAMKAVWDGFEDAGLYADDRAVWFGFIVGVVKKKTAEVRLTLSEEYPPEIGGLT